MCWGVGKCWGRSVLGCGVGVREVLEEVWESVLGCGEMLGEMWGEVCWGVGKCVGVWGRC